MDVITGPGDYRCANGSLAVVEEHDPNADRDYPWAGHVVGDPFKTQRRRWASDGSRPDHFTHQKEFRIVSRIVPKPTPEQARIAALEALLRDIIDDASPCTTACNLLVEERLIERAKELLG